MENTNKVTMKEVARKYIGYGLITILAFGLMLVLISAFSQKATADDSKKTLQESVEMAQADYDLSQAQALDSMRSYCKNWVELSNAKVALANSLKIKTTQVVADVNVCEGVYVPTSF
jgi:hypothetical protein